MLSCTCSGCAVDLKIVPSKWTAHCEDEPCCTACQAVEQAAAKARAEEEAAEATAKAADGEKEGAEAVELKESSAEDEKDGGAAAALPPPPGDPEAFKDDKILVGDVNSDSTHVPLHSRRFLIGAAAAVAAGGTPRPSMTTKSWQVVHNFFPSCTAWTADA